MKSRRQSGFSLIELTLVVGLSMLIAASLAGMFQVHLQMMHEAVKYEFLAQDAPFVGLLLTRTIGNAEDYRIYSSRTVAVANGTPVLSGPVVKLWMRQPNSSFRQAILSYESVNGHSGIYFFLADPITGTFPGPPSWELAGGQLTAANFNANSAAAPGVLLATLTGSYNDQYTFAAEKQ